MAVTREELHQMVDHLTDEDADAVYTYIKELQELKEDELSEGQVNGLYDQDAYFEEGEINPTDDPEGPEKPPKGRNL
ncbi:hypothetical protein [Sinobaca sp. H24]|uniref:hypothetical protein n=1 Tax=Sinobaca sp. H24 TaxID=2923376 RepID=UPI00207979A1|nr:hypothetical protein [Sinobaca sp. H24]